MQKSPNGRNTLAEWTFVNFQMEQLVNIIPLMRTHNKAERHVQKTILNLNLMIKIRRAGALASLALRFGAIIIVTAVMIVTAITGASAQAAAPAAVATIAPD